MRRASLYLEGKGESERGDKHFSSTRKTIQRFPTNCEKRLRSSKEQSIASDHITSFVSQPPDLLMSRSYVARHEERATSPNTRPIGTNPSEAPRLAAWPLLWLQYKKHNHIHPIIYNDHHSEQANMNPNLQAHLRAHTRTSTRTDTT